MAEMSKSELRGKLREIIGRDHFPGLAGSLAQEKEKPSEQRPEAFHPLKLAEGMLALQADVKFLAQALLDN